MIAPDLLELLRCPETRQRLALASPEKLAEINARASATEGALRNRQGVALDEPLAGALLRADGAVAYPIRGGIPILLVEEAIVL